MDGVEREVVSRGWVRKQRPDAGGARRRRRGSMLTRLRGEKGKERLLPAWQLVVWSGRRCELRSCDELEKSLGLGSRCFSACGEMYRALTLASLFHLGLQQTVYDMVLSEVWIISFLGG